MDPLITNLCERARRNDPRLRHVSLRSLPLLEVTNEEMYAVVESLEHNTHVGTFDMSIDYQDNTGADVVEAENNNNEPNAEEAADEDIPMEMEIEIENDNGDDTTITPTVVSISPPPPPPFEYIFSRNTSLVDVRISSPSSFILASVFRGLALNMSVQILQVGEMSATGDTNDMDADCALELKHMLERNSSIHRLALQGFRWDDNQALQWVAGGLRANKALRVLELLQIATTTATATTAIAATQIGDEEHSTNLMSAIGAMKHLKRLSIIACEMSDMSFSCGDHIITVGNSAVEQNRNSDGSGLNMDIDIPMITSIPSVNNDIPMITSIPSVNKECSKDKADKETCSKSHHSENDNDIDDDNDKPQLEELRLVECELTGPAVYSLQRGWKHNPFLRILDVRGNSLEDDSCHAIAEILNTATSLTKVILEDNNIGDEGLASLSQNGLGQNKTLKQLCLKENDFGPLGVQALADALQHNQCLEELDLSYNTVSDGGATALGGMLERNTALQDLVLESAMIGGTGVLGLSSGLRSNKTLRKLNLSGNTFGETGILALTTLLATEEGSPCSLTSLRLSSCQLGDVGVAALATALERNTRLEEMILPFNRFGDDGANAIGQSLPRWQGLVSLQIQFNLFSEAGFEKIVKGLSKNFYLKSMYLLNAGPSNRKIDKLFHEMQHWIRLNKGGRRVLNEQETLSPALWPLVLAKAGKAYSSDAIHFLLKERPDIVGASRTTRTASD